MTQLGDNDFSLFSKVTQKDVIIIIVAIVV